MKKLLFTAIAFLPLLLFGQDQAIGTLHYYRSNSLLVLDGLIWPAQVNSAAFSNAVNAVSDGSGGSGESNSVSPGSIAILVTTNGASYSVDVNTNHIATLVSNVHLSIGPKLIFDTDYFDTLIDLDDNTTVTILPSLTNSFITTNTLTSHIQSATNDMARLSQDNIFSGSSNRFVNIGASGGIFTFGTTNLLSGATTIGDLYTISGTRTIRPAFRRLMDASDTISLDWSTRDLQGNWIFTGTSNWNSGILTISGNLNGQSGIFTYGSTNLLSGATTLGDVYTIAAGNLSIRPSFRRLIDSSGGISLDWNTRDLQSNWIFTGSSNWTAGDFKVETNLYVGGNINGSVGNFSGSGASVIGDLNITNDLNVTNNARIHQNLVVDGTITAGGLSSSIYGDEVFMNATVTLRVPSGGTTLTVLGDTASMVGTAQGGVASGIPMYAGVSCAATAGTDFGYNGNSILNSYHPLRYYSYHRLTNTTNIRMWFGVTATAATTHAGSINPSGDYMAFLYDSTNNANILCISKNGTGSQHIADSGIPGSDLTNGLTMRIDYVRENHAKFYIGGTLITNITTLASLPRTNQAFRVINFGEPTADEAKAIQFHRIVATQVAP